MVEAHFPVIRDADRTRDVRAFSAFDVAPLLHDSGGAPWIEAGADLLPGGGRDVEIQAIAHLLPDGQRMVANLAVEGKEAWVLLDRRGGKPKIPTHEGMGIAFASISPLSPDGTKFIVGNSLDWFIQPLAGGEAQPIRGMLPGERVVGWSADGGAVFVRPELSVLPVTITRLDLKSSVRSQILAFTPPDPAGHIQTRGVFMSPDARAFAFTYEKKLSELYLVEGLK